MALLASLQTAALMIPKLLFVPIAAVVFAAPRGGADQGRPNSKLYPIDEGEMRELIIDDDMVGDLRQMQRELEEMREEAMSEALEELSTVEAKIEDLEAERAIILERLQKISAPITPLIPEGSTPPAPARRYRPSAL